MKVDDERWRFPTRAAPPASSLLERRFVVSITSGAQKTLVPCAGGESTRELLDEVLEKLRDRSERPPSISRAGPPPLPPRPPTTRTPVQYETPETVALRLKSRRSYLLRLDAPIVSNSDVADALRASVARVPTVELVLERDLSDKDQSLLTAQRKRLEATPILYEDTLPPKEVAQAIRSTDVDKLATLPDAVLETFIPQLTQALKRGQPGDLLTKFLLERALANPVYVGSTLFWALRCEMRQGGEVAGRHGAILACYLGACGSKCRGDLAKQVELDRILGDLTTTASEMDDRRARTQFARQRLKSLSRSGELPADLDLPCAPGRRVGRIRADSVKVLSSKAAPILLHFDDASDEEGSPILAIYKARDDLRQDAAMLQVMRQMDRMWLDAGLECWLRTYSVCATQPDSGWIEVVSDATETAEVQQTYGGGALGGAFQSNTLNRFLEDKNRDDPRAFPACVERFAASCAACCVATYALGVADRHNGNIMLSTDGRLFHIDFGHVLGHFKRIRGVGARRERTKLVLTPEMMFLINKTKVVEKSFIFDDAGTSDAMKLHDGFAERCQALLDVLNRPGHVALLLQTLKELVPAGLPEITDESLAWLPRAVTSSELKPELKAALADWVRRLDNANHNRVHRESGSVLKPRERPASTLMEAHVEVEELRTLLSRANARADALQRDLDQLRGLDGSSRPSGSRVL